MLIGTYIFMPLVLEIATSACRPPRNDFDSSLRLSNCSKNRFFYKLFYVSAESTLRSFRRVLLYSDYSLSSSMIFIISSHLVSMSVTSLNWVRQRSRLWS